MYIDRIASCLGGVFANPRTGEVGALWSSYSYNNSQGEVREMNLGMPIELLADVVLPLRCGKVPDIPTLSIELNLVPLSKARSGLSLPSEWVTLLEKISGDRRQVLGVRRTMPNTSAHEVLREGDLVLAVNKQPVTTFRQYEANVIYGPDGLQGLTNQVTSTSSLLDLYQNFTPSFSPVNFTILRDGKEMIVAVKPTKLSGEGTSRLVVWSGLVLQMVHDPVIARGFVPPEGGVYISRWSYGSPAHKGGLRATNWIVKINDSPTPDLDTFLDAVAKIGDGVDVRIHCTDLHNRNRVYSLCTDLGYFGSVELRRVSRTDPVNLQPGNSIIDGNYEWCLVRK